MSTTTSIQSNSTNAIDPGTTVGLLALTVVLLPSLGFRLTILSLALLLLLVVGRQHWLVAIVMSLAVSFGTFYVFDLLGIFLPTGPRGI